MSGDKRILQINPELFSLSNNTTRKRQKKTDGDGGGGGIRMKDSLCKSAASRKEETIKNRTALLRMLRKTQEEKYKQMTEGKPRISVSLEQMPTADATANREFEEAKNYMDRLSKKTETAVLPPPQIRMNQPIQYMSDYIVKPPVASATLSNQYPHQHVQPTTLPQPQPRPPPQLQPQLQPQPSFNFVGGEQTMPHRIPAGEITTKNATQIIDEKINESLKRVSEMRQTTEKLEEMKHENPRSKIKKQKKTIKRTYNIGKSKAIPRVGVLISNKTIRSNVSTKTQQLKQVPMQDVKKYLMKRGFIKVGSTAPNDVLRKMYESSILVCGEIQNHNPDNLLYNYLNQSGTDGTV